MQSGIYIILNTVNSTKYIGSAVNIKCRFRSHVRDLEKGLHQRYLQNAWNKHGQSSFQFLELEYCEKDKLIEREQYWINHFKSFDRKNGYNIAPIAGNCLGVKHSNETRDKFRQVKIGKTLSEEHKEKIRITMTGRKRPKEFCEKLSRATKGKRKKSLSEETKQKMRLAHLGIPVSEETRQKISEAQKGSNNSMYGKKVSDETKEKISKALKGNNRSNETKGKISKALKGNNWNVGRKHSDIAKENMRIGWVNRRQIATGGVN